MAPNIEMERVATVIVALQSLGEDIFLVSLYDNLAGPFSIANHFVTVGYNSLPLERRTDQFNKNMQIFASR